MKFLSTVLVLFLCQQAVASQKCFRIGLDKTVLANSQEQLCVSKTENPEEYKIELTRESSLSSSPSIVFNLNRIYKTNCSECNKDLFGPLDSENSSFAFFKIKFNGQRNPITHKESGQVKIGENLFYYESL